MISFLAAFGRFLRILDESNQISLTNIAVYIALYKLMVTPATNYADIAALLAAMGTYTIKKIIA